MCLKLVIGESPRVSQVFLRKVFVLFVLLIAWVQVSHGQTYTSQNNRTQVWSDNVTWGTTPPNTNITGIVNIYGWVTQSGALSVSNSGGAALNIYDTLTVTGAFTNNGAFTVTAGGIFNAASFSNANSGSTNATIAGKVNISGTFSNSKNLLIQVGGVVTVDGNYVNENTSSALDIYGTLIIKGNFTANSTVRVRPGGLLIILGNLTMPNTGPGIVNEGQTVVVGEVDIQGGSVQTGNQFYIFDDTPTYSNTSPSVDGVTYNGSNGGALTAEFPTESSIPPALLEILEGLGVACGGYNSISGSYACSGSPSTVITGSNIAGVTYAWEQSTTSATTGFTVINGATGKDYSPGVITQTTWFRRRVTKTSPACTTLSATVQLTAYGSIWTGANGNNNLNTAGNWCGGVPTATTNVLIPSGLDSWKYPTSGSLVAKDVVIQSGATISIADNQAITVNGNLSNAGTITAGWNNNPTLNLSGNFINTGTLTFNSSTAGTIRFQGSAQQTVTGGPYTFPNLIVNTGTSQVVFPSNVTVNGTFTLTSGVVNMSGTTLTLGTTISSTGTLTYTAGRIANGTFRRYITNGAQSNVHFPMGTLTDNRPFSFTTTANISTGGTMSVTHVGVATVTTGLNIADGGTIERRQNSSWTVTSGNGLAGGTYTISAGGTGFVVGDIAHLRLMRASGVVPSPSAHVAATGSPANFMVGRSNVSLASLTGGALYIGSINGTLTPLPVKLLSFTAAYNGAAVDLNWSTANEADFSHFEIEQAGEDFQFYSIGEVKGAGYATEDTQRYTFTDSNPVSGINYYRLKAVDTDGSFEYFPVVKVVVTTPRAVNVYANPSNGEFVNIKTNFNPGELTRVVVYTSDGTVIGHYAVSGRDLRIDFARRLASGLYLVKYTGSDFSQVVRFAVK